jgi:hypothetical protein
MRDSAVQFHVEHCDTNEIQRDFPMPGCVLYVTGENFDPHSVLAAIILQPYQIFRKGDLRSPGSKTTKLHRVAGFKCDVSRSDGILSEEITDAIKFLRQHEADIRHLRSVTEVTSMTLDFGINSRLDGRTCVVQIERLPLPLLELCGSIGVEIELSLYPPQMQEPTPSENV